MLASSYVTLGLEFGVYVSHDELVEVGSPVCSICYESMKQPVKLACSHMFCEECVTEWFDHERSCPLCRASVESSGLTDAANVKPHFFLTVGLVSCRSFCRRTMIELVCLIVYLDMLSLSHVAYVISDGCR